MNQMIVIFLDRVLARNKSNVRGNEYNVVNKLELELICICKGADRRRVELTLEKTRSA